VDGPGLFDELCKFHFLVLASNVRTSEAAPTTLAKMVGYSLCHKSSMHPPSITHRAACMLVPSPFKPAHACMYVHIWMRAAHTESGAQIVANRHRLTQPHVVHVQNGYNAHRYFCIMHTDMSTCDSLGLNCDHWSKGMRSSSKSTPVP